MMFGVVDVHGDGVDIGLERAFFVRKFGKGERHVG